MDEELFSDKKYFKRGPLSHGDEPSPSKDINSIF